MNSLLILDILLQFYFVAIIYFVYFLKYNNTWKELITLNGYKRQLTDCVFQQRKALGKANWNQELH